MLRWLEIQIPWQRFFEFAIIAESPVFSYNSEIELAAVVIILCISLRHETTDTVWSVRIRRVKRYVDILSFTARR